MKKILETLKLKWAEYLLEILVITIGILGAFILNNWNENRIASNKEETLLLELHQEFIENKKQFDIVMSKHKEALKACDAFIAKFPINHETVNLDSLPDRSDGLYRRWTFNPSQGIINSLISTSSFELISNPELRKLLVSWNDVLLDFQEDEIGSEKYVTEVFNPFMNQYFHYSSGYFDPRLDLSIFSSSVFENLIFQRKEHLIDILGRDDEFVRIKKTIDRIIELSDPERTI